VGVEEGLEDAQRGGGRRHAAMAAVSDQRHDDQLGIVERRHARIPGVGLVGRHLGGARLAADDGEELAEDGGGGAAAAVRGLVQALLELGDELGREVEVALGRRLDALDDVAVSVHHRLGHVRRHQLAAVGDGAVGGRELER
jgi:hypothetical protein